MTILQFVFSLVILIAGADLLVRGASRLAKSLGISTLVVGLVVVAFGTSAPELAVSIQAALAGQGGIAMGNIVGSNIINLLCILGLSALITPLVIHQQVVKLELPVVIGASLLMYIFARNGTIHFVEGLTLVLLLFGYIGFQFVNSRIKAAASKNNLQQPPQQLNWKTNALLLVVGLVMLVVGAYFLVESASIFARRLGVSEVIIGLTIVAIGTSLPEIVTSVIAAIRGERDIAIGNVMGSSIFNIFCVLGFTSLVAPEPIAVDSQLIQVDIPLMLAATILAFPLFFSGHCISRLEGGMFFGLYVLYTIWLVFSATGNPLVNLLVSFSLYGVIPVVLLVTGWSLVTEIRRK